MSPGPLDELFPGLRASDAVPDEPLHPGVLAMPHGDGMEMLFVSWRDPGGPRALHAALRALVEGALLAELSQPLAHARPTLTGLRLLSFAPVDRFDEAVTAFGFRRTNGRGERWQTATAHARGEASRLGRAVPDQPVAHFIAETETTQDALQLAEAIRRRVGELVWGERPGAFAAEVAAESLDALERRWVPDVEERLRWIPPACFQALCDRVGLAIEERGRGPVAWAQCDPNEEGMAPPPLLRLAAADGDVHLPVGLELLQWCVMPRRAGEQIPPLSAWLGDRLGG